MNSGSPHAPQITIGITCFREGEQLRECWDSVLRQTDDRWTAVLVMDGDADVATRTVFERLQHSRLRKFVLSENVGPYPARNRAFELTTTPYHFYLDGDDQLLPNSVADVLATFERHPHAGFVYGDYECFGETTEIWRHPVSVDAEDFVDTQPTPGGCAYSRALWSRLGGFAPELALGNADYDFLIGAYEVGSVGLHCGGVFYRYRIGRGSQVSNSYHRRAHETREVMVRRHPIFFRDHSRRRRFLAIGYRHSAIASRAAGDLAAAARLARRACQLGLWQDRELQLILVEAAMPTWMLRTLTKAWRLRAKSAAAS